MRPHLREFTFVRGLWYVRNQLLRLAPSKSQDRKRSLFCDRFSPGKFTSVATCGRRAGESRRTDCRSSLRREVVEKTSAKYGEAFERLTGSRLYVDQ